MNKIVLVILFVNFVGFSALAQKQFDKKGHCPAPNNAGAMAVALHLNSADSVKFVAVYQKYLDEMKSCGDKYFKQRPNGDEKMTDEKAESIIKDQFAFAHKSLEIREAYYPKLKTVLQPKKILKLYKFEKNRFDNARDELRRRRVDKGDRMSAPHNGGQCPPIAD